MKPLNILIAILFFQTTWASEQSILSQTGCFQVQFKFQETFPLQSGYEIRPGYQSGALEWITQDPSPIGEIHLQHLLVLGEKAVLKHWRQEWVKNPSDRFAFKGDRRWVKEELSNPPGSEVWLQKVFQVDDSPRYACAAPWVSWKDQNYWECKSWNPLPRREFSSRSDYNVLIRRNRHAITDYGWVHEQDNTKVIANQGQLVESLVKEKGENTYQRVDDEMCIQAKKWWAENRATWVAIQSAWRTEYEARDVLEFHKTDEPLWRKLFALAHSATTNNWTSQETQEKARALILSAMK